jgi:hypothetical protein
MDFGLSASRWSAEASFRVGEFSTGTMGNFRTELTVVNDADAEAALGEGWGNSPTGPFGLPVGSDPLRGFETWDLRGLSPGARLRIGAGLVHAHADIVASSGEDGSRVRQVSLQKAFDLFAGEYLAAGLLTESIMQESIPQNIYDAAVSGGWQTGTLERNSGCTRQFGHYWVPDNVPEMLRALFEAQVWRWRAKLLEANAHWGEPVVGCDTGISPGGPRLRGDRSVERWEDIEIRFLSDERVQIFICGTPGDSRNFAEMGFEDRRGKGGKPNRAWHALLALATNDGIIPATAISGQQGIQKRAQTIRQLLCDHFQITENPLPFVAGTGYKTRFKIARSAACET